MKIFAILAILGICISYLNGSAIKPFIIGGENAAKNEIPFLVEIWWNTWIRLEFGCSGIILTENMILTTARCVHDIHFLELLPPIYIHVVAGDPEGIRDENSDLLLPVRRVIVHPDWVQLSDSNENDIAILELTSPLEITPGKIEIATLPQSSEVNAGDSGIVTGWGNEEEAGGDTDRHYKDVLQKLTVIVSNNKDCERKFGVDLISEQHFCAGSATGSVCYGDQGSPFIVSDGADPPTVLGLVSNVKRCVSDGVGALFIKLAPHLDWITEQVDIATTEMPTTSTEEPKPTTKATTLEEVTTPEVTTESPGEQSSENPIPTTTESPGDVTDSPVPTSTNNGFKVKCQNIFVWMFAVISMLFVLNNY